MPEVGKIDFKSVGTKPTLRTSDTERQNRVPIGIRTPMRLGQGSDGIYAMNRTIAEEVRQNLSNLILTNWGERVGRYHFGANLRELTLELGSEEYDEEVAVRIKSATSRWMPYVLLIGMERFVDSVDDEPLAKIRLRIVYDVPAVGLKNQVLDVQFFIAG